MTRPAGTTPRGLPFPGSNATIADTPAALQALAEAITAQLGSIGVGLMLDTFTGKVTTGPNVTYWYVGQFVIPFPKLATVQGSIVSYGNFLGGPTRAGFVSVPGPGNGKPDIDPTKWSITPWKGSDIVAGAEKFGNTDITICAVGWGTPK